jgi:hypothetical protein
MRHTTLDPVGQLLGLGAAPTRRKRLEPHFNNTSKHEFLTLPERDACRVATFHEAYLDPKGHMLAFWLGKYAWENTTRGVTHRGFNFSTVQVDVEVDSEAKLTRPLLLVQGVFRPGGKAITFYWDDRLLDAQGTGMAQEYRGPKWVYGFADLIALEAPAVVRPFNDHTPRDQLHLCANALRRVRYVEEHNRDMRRRQRAYDDDLSYDPDADYE